MANPYLTALLAREAAARAKAAKAKPTKAKAKPTKAKAKPTKAKAKPTKAKAKLTKAKPTKPTKVAKVAKGVTWEEALGTDEVKNEMARQHRVAAATRYQKGLRGRNSLLWEKLVKRLPKHGVADVGKIFYAALPTKAEAAQGKKFIPSRITGKRKVFSYYVNKKGAIVPILEKGAPHYARPLTIKVIGAVPKYVYKKSYVTQFRSLYSIRDTSKAIDDPTAVREIFPCIDAKKGREISWDTIVERVTNTLENAMAKDFKGSNVNFIVQIRDAVVQRVDDNTKLPFSSFTGIEFHSRALQKYTPTGIRNFVSRTVYAHFAEALSQAELVTTGSAAYVWAMYNEPTDERENLTDDRGLKWEKRDFSDVKITHFCWDIASLKIKV